PLPAPESYDSDSAGPKPPRPGDVTIGTAMLLVPVTGLVDSFSPMPRIAPPPFGNSTTGGDIEKRRFSGVTRRPCSILAPRRDAHLVAFAWFDDRVGRYSPANDGNRAAGLARDAARPDQAVDQLAGAGLGARASRVPRVAVRDQRHPAGA